MSEYKKFSRPVPDKALNLARAYGPDFEFDHRRLFLKYAVDKLTGAVLIVALLPVCAAIMAAIALEALFFADSRGPVFIIDERISQGRPFGMSKFRTYFIQDDEKNADKQGHTDFINVRDVTRVGGVLRKFYLDEIPQLFNILAGHMSFVGPRPVPDHQYETCLKLGYQNKRVLRGGLCGPLQGLKGRWGEFKDYLSVDEQLIGEYRSRTPMGVVALDLRIALMTFRKIADADGLLDPFGRDAEKKRDPS